MTLQRHTPMQRGKGLKRSKASGKRSKRKSEVRTLKARADEVAALWVKEAHDWTCSKCGKEFGGRHASAHWSHIFSRRHHSIRWDPANSVLHCAGCHRWYHEAPPESGHWVREAWLGHGRYELLVERKNQTRKWTATELRALLEHIEEDRARIARLREEGQTGYIAPIAFD